MKTKTLISIVGPTAIGKTALSIALAQHFNTEIISADSRQFYKELSIGTAVPSEEELKAVPHHFIQHISINDSYSVGAFEKEALAKLDMLFKVSDNTIMVGGSGLYTNAVVNGLDKFPEVDAAMREELNQRLITEGIEALQNQLLQLDKKSYNTIDINNPQRLIRALEVSIVTGKAYSTFLDKPKPKRQFRPITIGLNAERSEIYARINARVEIMIANGLVDEAKSLYQFKHLNALNTVGYKELFKYFDGYWTLDTAISEIKKNTRRFAKRQLTWYRKDASIKWFNYKDDKQLIVKLIEKQLTS